MLPATVLLPQVSGGSLCISLRTSLHPSVHQFENLLVARVNDYGVDLNGMVNRKYRSRKFPRPPSNHLPPVLTQSQSRYRVV